MWIFGPQVEVQYPALPTALPDPGSRLLPDLRYPVVRTGWDPADRYRLFNAAPRGGGHAGRLPQPESAATLIQHERGRGRQETSTVQEIKCLPLRFCE